MNGEGFKAFVKNGDKVKAGDKLIEADIDLINKNEKSSITPIVITNTHNFNSIKGLKKGNVNFNDELISVEFK